MRTPLQNGEKILLVTRTSVLSFAWPVLVALAALVAAILISMPPVWRLVVGLVGVLIFLCKYWMWKVDIWVVTNYRVIDEMGLLSHFAKESPLEKINNVSYDQSLWGRIFNYGHVEIQTAAQIGATDYYNVFHPKRLKDVITLAQSEYKSLQFNNQAEQMAKAMANQVIGGASSMTAELEKLFELKQKGALSEAEYLQAKNTLLNWGQR